jgi:hypothetical protein
MDLCSDCKCKPGWHQLWCPRAHRAMTAIARRLREAEKGEA